jgi:molecular chaperone DnaK (HSP70)
VTTSTDSNPPRYLVGIDLGTTNSAVSYVDTGADRWAVRDFPVPQLVAPAETEPRPVLPSFHYEPAPTEFAAGAIDLPWSDSPESSVVGLFAREHGAAVPGRLVVSAKSWLSHGGVDRTAALLPWHGAPDATRLSPVEVSRRYLAHMRAAWDHAHPGAPLAEQDVILTVPASFDEVARELTVEAAKTAGIARVTLLEEPQAAFYAWINGQGDAWERKVRAGPKI